MVISAAPADVVAAEDAAPVDGLCRHGSAAPSCSAARRGGDSDSSVDAVDPFSLLQGSPPPPPTGPRPPTPAPEPAGDPPLGRLMWSERSGDAAELASISHPPPRARAGLDCTRECLRGWTAMKDRTEKKVLGGVLGWPVLCFGRKEGLCFGVAVPLGGWGALSPFVSVSSTGVTTSSFSLNLQT